MGASRVSDDKFQPVPGFDAGYFLEVRIGQKVKSKAYEFELKDKLIDKAYPDPKLTNEQKKSLSSEDVLARLTEPEDIVAWKDIVDVVGLNTRASKLKSEESREDLEKQVLEWNLNELDDVIAKLPSSRQRAVIDREKSEVNDQLAGKVTALKALVQSATFPEINDASLTGAKLDEFKLLYQIEVMNMCLLDNKFKALLERAQTTQLSPADQQLYGEYQIKLLELSLNAKKAFDFTIEEIKRVGYPTEPQEQYSKAIQLVGGIDLTKEVKVTTMPIGTIVHQMQQDSEGGTKLRIGDYFALERTAASQLGIADASSGSIISALAGTGSSVKVVRSYQIQHEVKCLESTAGPIADDWSHQTPIITPGGAHQLYIPLSLADKKQYYKFITSVELLEKERDSTIGETKDNVVAARVSESEQKTLMPALSRLKSTIDVISERRKALSETLSEISPDSPDYVKAQQEHKKLGVREHVLRLMQVANEVRMELAVLNTFKHRATDELKFVKEELGKLNEMDALKKELEELESQLKEKEPKPEVTEKTLEELFIEGLDILKREESGELKNQSGLSDSAPKDAPNPEVVLLKVQIAAVSEQIELRKTLEARRAELLALEAELASKPKFSQVRQPPKSPMSARYSTMSKEDMARIRDSLSSPISRDSVSSSRPSVSSSRPSETSPRPSETSPRESTVVSPASTAKIHEIMYPERQKSSLTEAKNTYAAEIKKEKESPKQVTAANTTKLTIQVPEQPSIVEPTPTTTPTTTPTSSPKSRPK